MTTLHHFLYFRIRNGRAWSASAGPEVQQRNPGRAGGGRLPAVHLPSGQDRDRGPGRGGPAPDLRRRLHGPPGPGPAQRQAHHLRAEVRGGPDLPGGDEGEEGVPYPRRLEERVLRDQTEVLTGAYFQDGTVWNTSVRSPAVRSSHQRFRSNIREGEVHLDPETFQNQAYLSRKTR